MNYHPWQEWNPRLEDYWDSFVHPYRYKVRDHVSKHTPLNGTVLEFGCSVGINLFLLKLERPDIKIIGMDMNTQGRNLATMMLKPWGAVILPHPKTSKDIPEVDTIFTTFTMAYLEYPHLRSHIDIFEKKAKTLIFAEPTMFGDRNESMEFTGSPCIGWTYNYPYIMTNEGWDVVVDKITPDLEPNGNARINAITIAKEHV